MCDDIFNNHMLRYFMDYGKYFMTAKDSKNFAIIQQTVLIFIFQYRLSLFMSNIEKDSE